MNFRNKLFIISFIEGASVMATEIGGAKLLAPFFGSSLYVWSSILSITLGGLAFGYFLGGKFSQKENRQTLLLYILILAFAYLAIIPILTYFIPFVALHFSLIPAVIISSIIIIFPSMSLMGTTSPLLVSLLTQHSTDSGFYSGKIYAISTVGGIISTFACGFYLIPTVGITNTLLLFAMLLLLVSLFLLKKKTYKSLVSILVIIIAVTGYSFKNSSNKNGTIYKEEGMLGSLEIRDEKNSDSVIVRRLYINNIVQTEMNFKTKHTTSAYISILESNLSLFHIKNALVLGLGGGLAANTLAEHSINVIGIEFDERVINCAKKYFNLNKSINTICSDARFYLNNCKTKYDLLFFDLYKSEEQPSHVITMESLKSIKNNLSDSAVIIINTHGYLNGNIGRGTQCLLSTLKASGFNIKICTNTNDENYRNLLVIASIKKLNTNLNFEIPYTINNPEIVNTDNKPILEKLNAEANQAWRTNYLRNYILTH